MRIRLDAVGCRLNISEIERMGRSFVQAGHRLVGPGDVADLYIFNSCAVTNDASKVSRKIIRQLRAANPQAKVVATGCYADLEPAAVQALGVDWVVDNRQKDDLPLLLAERGWLDTAEPIPNNTETAYFPPQPINRTRAFIKVQDGCKNKCTFCIVTVARGESRSRNIADVVAEVNTLYQEGYREAVLSGVHLGSFGHDTGNPHGLKQLVSALLADTDIPRIRLSSLEPWEIAPGFFNLWQNPRLQAHFHLPLQSGCDTTLRRMARKTSQTSYRTLLEQARTAIPHVAISTDIIVGFPGEDEHEFATSLSFIEEMAFSRLHIFRYSRRAGTAAATMPQQVPAEIVKQRSQRLHVLGAELENRYNQRFIGKTLAVLWEHSEPFGFGKRWSGLNEQFVRVVLDTSPLSELHNSIGQAKIVSTLPGALLAEAQTMEMQLQIAEKLMR
jgi:threonylcarbamoyladenosine tRNA methylthiotransferase MtaB